MLGGCSDGFAVLAAKASAHPGGDVVGQPSQTNLDETMRWEASLPW